MNAKEFFDQKISLIAKESKIVLDVGGGKKFAKGMKEYEDLFTNIDFKTLDNVAEYQPDILGDIMNIPISNEAVDAVICKAVLEHVTDPFKASAEIYRILKPGGKCLGYVPFLYPFHAEKGKYGDYWRYTHEGIANLFKQFSKVEIVSVRGSLETMIYLLPIKFLRKGLSPLARLVDKIFKTYNQPSGYNFYLEK